MRVEMSSLLKSLTELPKAIDKKEVTSATQKENENSAGEAQVFIPSPIGSSRTYSPASLRAAVDYHVKFLTVAENNLRAAEHSSGIPQALLDRLNGR